MRSCRQQHYPMDPDEAKMCLKELVSKVAIAIVNLHSHGWAHQDIRLENICFTNEQQPIFINLDQVCAINGSPVIYPDSCMYQEGFTATQMDWMQLGWVATWAYCKRDTDYHK